MAAQCPGNKIPDNRADQRADQDFGGDIHHAGILIPTKWFWPLPYPKMHRQIGDCSEDYRLRWR